MKSVLLSTDFVKNNNGELQPLEINTNTYISLKLNEYPLTPSNFESNLSDFFNYQGLKQFLDQNSIVKITLIESEETNNYIYFETFCEFYGLTFELVKVGRDELTVPDLEDVDDTLIIRVAYDSYAIIDDLYARDMLEFHNLIVSESFAPKVSFKDTEQLDTITEISASLGIDYPNYILKARYPGSTVYEYPQLYNFETQEELDGKKSMLVETEFLSEFILDSGSLSEKDGRVSFFRSSDLIIGSDLTVLNLFTYEETNEVSIDNERLIYDVAIDSTTKQLNRLHSSRFIPLTKLFMSNHYHFDQFDKVLDNSENLVTFGNITQGDLVKVIDYDNDVIENFVVSEDNINNFMILSSSVENISETTIEHMFTNISAHNDTFGSFSWYDGTSNKYFVKKQNDSTVRFLKSNEVEIGDTIYVFDYQQKIHVSMIVQDLFFDLKNITTYLINLEPKPIFFVEIDNDEYPSGNSPLFLVQHNPACYSGPSCAMYNCFGPYCDGCGKFAPGCINCGGSESAGCY